MRLGNRGGRIFIFWRGRFLTPTGRCSTQSLEWISTPQFAEIDRRIPTLSDYEIVVELARLATMLGEGHTRISLPNQPEAMDPAGRESKAITPAKDPRLAFHRLPLRLAWFSDGLFVVAATREFRSLLRAPDTGAVADHCWARAS